MIKILLRFWNIILIIIVIAGDILDIFSVIVAFYFLLISANFEGFHFITYNLGLFLTFIIGVIFFMPFRISAVAILIVIVIAAVCFGYFVFFYFINVSVFISLILLLFYFFSAFLLISELMPFYFNNSFVLTSNYKNAILSYIFSIFCHTKLLLVANKISLKFP